MTPQSWAYLAGVALVLLDIAASAALGLGLLWLWFRLTPSHWALSGPQRRSRPGSEVFCRPNVAGGHAKSLRRLIRLGPWGVYVIRYATGHVDVPQPERIP